MDPILNIAKEISPLGVIALCVVIIYQLVKGKGLMSAIRGTQEEKYPQLEQFMQTMSRLNEQNETLLENHFKHEIPELMSTLNRIDQKNDRMIEILTRIDTKLK